LRGEVPDSGDFEELSRAGFFDAFKSFAFEHRNVNQFSWANPNAAGLKWYVETFPIDSVVAKALCHAFSGSNHPSRLANSFGSYWPKTPRSERSSTLPRLRWVKRFPRFSFLTKRKTCRDEFANVNPSTARRSALTRASATEQLRCERG
jgi:hypothetical protein